MTYREIGISIRSAYSQGWPDDASRLAFRTETRKLFRDAGWQVEEMPLDSGHCDMVRNGKDALYLHPTVFSGVMQEDHIPALQQLLDIRIPALLKLHQLMKIQPKPPDGRLFEALEKCVIFPLGKKGFHAGTELRR